MNAFFRFSAVAVLTMTVTAFSPPVVLAQDRALVGVSLFDNQLFRIDPTTGAGTLIGNLSENQAAYGIAARFNDLYTFDSNADVLRRINPSNAATVATIDIGVGDLAGEGDLAFNSTGTGFLFSALNPVDFSAANQLYTFDVLAGTSSLIGTTAFGLDALAFGGGDVLYGLSVETASLYTINTTNGATTLIGGLGLPQVIPGITQPSSPIAGMTFLDGTLYAALDDQLYTINTTTGAATLINPDPDFPDIANTPIGFGSVSGLASVAAPEPATLALLLPFAVGVLRRRRA